MFQYGREGSYCIFLSTPSVGRATFYLAADGEIMVISIHALRGEGDPFPSMVVIFGKRFLSTPSVGRATGCWNKNNSGCAISIHALRGEGDGHKQILLPGEPHFYPRPPWGGRPPLSAASAKRVKFLSTPSVGRAT